MIEQAKFTYSPLGKAFENNKKTSEDQGKKQTKALEECRKQLVKSNAFAEKKKKAYHLISKKKYSLFLLRKELEKLKNYIIVLIFEIWCII